MTSLCADFTLVSFIFLISLGHIIGYIAIIESLASGTFTFLTCLIHANFSLFIYKSYLQSVPTKKYFVMSSYSKGL